MKTFHVDMMVRFFAKAENVSDAREMVEERLYAALKQELSGGEQSVVECLRAEEAELLLWQSPMQASVPLGAESEPEPASEIELESIDLEAAIGGGIRKR